ncbi:MAG: FtsX-like permease family protein [Burkholderiaceae bacterium]|nr:FtsX-like permease family protein [Burkholderiaceae bacterium]
MNAPRARTPVVLLRWLLLAQWRAQPGRAAIAVLAIAIGVALALAITLVNRSALSEFASAVSHAEGQAQAQIRASGDSFDEDLYARFAAEVDDVVASPIVDARFALADRPATSLRVIGIDVFRAVRVTPNLVPVVAASGARGGARSPLFDDDAIFLSNAALASLALAEGDRLELLADGRRVALRIAGTVPGAAAGQSLAVMDIGTMQWRLGWLRRLTRIDLRFGSGVDAQRLQAAWSERLVPHAYWATPEAGIERASTFSRAYRVNLNVLALVAWFTGAFIVHSTLALAVARQHRELALLAVLGARERWLGRHVLAQGLVIGGIGAVLGVAGGIALAAFLLARFGGDLGGGYFAQTRPSLVVDPLAAFAFALAGVGTGLVGSLAPARALRRLPAARSLRAGGIEQAVPAVDRRGAALACFVLGALLLALPGGGEIPWAAYAAIAAWLVGAIAALPRIVAIAGALGTRAVARRRGVALAWLAVQRLVGAPRSASAAMSAIVASVALAAAMSIMVTSFRVSVQGWLDTVLPADAYGRAVGGEAAGPIGRALQRAIASAPGVRRAEFLRVVEWNLDARRPPVTLLVRPIDHENPSSRLPMVGDLHDAPAGAIALYVSEAMVDVYGFRAGTFVERVLPAGSDATAASAGASAGRSATAPLFVAGVWRDYARQHGSVVVDSSDWRALGGDDSASDVAIWFDDATPRDAAWHALRAAVDGIAGFEWRSSAEIRARSLRIFDRSFAVTYALEAIAIAVALFGVASTWAGEGLARRREFATLQHLGLARAQIAVSFAIEAMLQIAIATAWGMAAGLAIALVLIRRVNPQSFHWTMQLAWPGSLLAASVLALLALGTFSAVAAALRAVGDPVRALAEDT